MKRIVTFNIGGPMRGYFIELDAESETIIRNFCFLHWPKDWVTTYSPEEFEPQIEKYHLKSLCIGWLELYNNQIYFHEGAQGEVPDNNDYQID